MLRTWCKLTSSSWCFGRRVTFFIIFSLVGSVNPQYPPMVRLALITRWQGTTFVEQGTATVGQRQATHLPAPSAARTGANGLFFMACPIAWQLPHPSSPARCLYVVTFPAHLRNEHGRAFAFA